MRDRRIIQWQRHYRKLFDDCERLGINCPAATVFEADLAKISLHDPDCIVKIIVTRGIGARGYAALEQVEPTRAVLSSTLPSYPSEYATEGVTVRLCDLRLAHQPRLAGIKHLNRLEQVMARNEWNDPAIAEGLLRDETDHMISGTMSNLFVIRDRQLFTPDLASCGIAGVTRDRIMASAVQLGLDLMVGQLELTELLAADEILLCNSVIGVWQIRELEENRWIKGRVTPLIRALLEKDDD